MNEYGIENVRGGAFCKINLEESSLKTIITMLCNSGNKCLNCGKSNHFIKQCPNMNKDTRKLFEEFGAMIMNFVYSLAYTNDKNDSKNEKQKLLSPKTNTNKKEKEKCNRCGRSNHTVNDCYATTDNDNKVLPCNRCGYDNHIAKDCYATRDINNKVLPYLKCGRNHEGSKNRNGNNHTAKDCYAGTDINGKKL